MSDRLISTILVAGLVAGITYCAKSPEDTSDAGMVAPAPGPGGLDGTSWRLVQFRGGDDTILTPNDNASAAR
ncbi:MAG TPA: hypothetical protein VFM14_16300 [Gemmatimonadales bacterium]|nr:hypothetical protein [Gemmatimonadales bacterium]